MDISSIFVVTAAVVFVGMLWFVRFNPQGVIWGFRLRLSDFDMDMLRETLNRTGLVALSIGLGRGFVGHSNDAVVTLALILAGILVCLLAAYKPSRRSSC